MIVAISILDISAALGISKQAALKRSERENWAFEEVSGRGGQKRIYPIAKLPKNIRIVIQNHSLKNALANVAEGVSVPFAHDHELTLTDTQRIERDARLGVKTAITRLMATGRCSQEAALNALLINARSGSLDPTTTRMLQLAKDPRGKKGVDRFPSVRSLKRWLSARDLAPKIPQKDMTIPSWAKTFLGFYQQPQKPTVQAAYQQFIEHIPPHERPSIHQARRFLAKLGSVTRKQGRMGSRELKNLQPFVRRDFSLLQPNDVWSADGHTFDAEVQHPFHGRPFRPEITTFCDIATRRATGWSVGLAESSFAVADALRNGVESYGIPALVYVDNGAGYRNAAMSDESTGLVGRIGSTITHSLPYNSQARGVIERLHQSIWVQGAKMLPSYVGAVMDREARLKQFKLSRSAIKNGGSVPLIPWHVFVQFCEERVEEYNNRPHRSLGGISPNQAWDSFLAKGWAPDMLVENELATLFRPRTTRTLSRAEIRLFNNIYFARELEEFHGMEVHVAYDIHNPDQVWVYLQDGRFICTAQVNGNSKHYFPVPVIEQAREKRAKGRLGRVNAKREEILEELHGSPALPAVGSGQVVIGGRVIDTRQIADLSRQPEALPAQPVPSAPLPPNVENIPPRSRSDRLPSENYADWLEIDQRIAAGARHCQQRQERDGRHCSAPGRSQVNPGVTALCPVVPDHWSQEVCGNRHGFH